MAPVVLVLALALAACAPGEPVKLATNPTGQGCFLASTIGLLIPDRVAGTAIVQEDMGKATVPVSWPAGYTGRRSGNDIEVVDSAGHVVARTGQRMKLLGGYGDGTWVACTDGVHPPG